MICEHLINGEIVYLVQPQRTGCIWTQQNKHLRSSVWNKDGVLISAGFPKFTNFGESPVEFPVPTNLNNAVITNKLDGSLLIVSKYKGHYIIRVRNYLNASQLETGHEIAIFKDRYLTILDDSCKNADTWEVSFLFEYLSVSKKYTIISYENVPDWILIGSVNHNDYSLVSQPALNAFAKLVGLKRPEQFKFNTISELLAIVADWKNQEGVVLYTNNGQTLHKIKSNDYKKQFAFKSNASLANTLQLFLDLGRPNITEFKQQISQLYDWECVDLINEHITKICNTDRLVQEYINEIVDFISKLKTQTQSRKEQAKAIRASKLNSCLLFTTLDNKPLDNKQVLALFQETWPNTKL